MKNSTALLFAMFGVASLTSAYESELNDREGRKLGWWKKDYLNLYQRCCMQTDTVLESDESPCTCPNRVEDEAQWWFWTIDVKSKFEKSCGKDGSIYRKGNIASFSNDPGSETGNIAEVATGAGGFETLLELVGLFPGIVEALTTQSSKDGTSPPLTVFAPKNDAFGAVLTALGVASIGEIKADQDKLDIVESVLLCHVVGGNFPSGILSDGAQVDTLGDSTVTVSVGDDIKININAIVSPADILANNGVIHVIDKVLNCEGGTF